MTLICSRSPDSAFRPLLAGWVLAAIACLGFGTGCHTLNTQLASSARPPRPQGSPIPNWIPRLPGTQTQTAQFDPAVLQPTTTAQHCVATGELLEITVWDLYEKDKPATFPVRVEPEGMLQLPLVSRISVADCSTSELESRITDAYVSQEILVRPRVVVRTLESPSLQISVVGAVQRPGSVALTGQDPSVYSALIAAGGLTRDAGSRLSISRPPAGDAIPADTADGSPADEAVWFDVSRQSDRDQLKELALREGDVLTIASASSQSRMADARLSGANPQARSGLLPARSAQESPNRPQILADSSTRPAAGLPIDLVD